MDKAQRNRNSSKPSSSSRTRRRRLRRYSSRNWSNRHKSNRRPYKSRTFLSRSKRWTCIDYKSNLRSNRWAQSQNQLTERIHQAKLCRAKKSQRTITTPEHLAFHLRNHWERSHSKFLKICQKEGIYLMNLWLLRSEWVHSWELILKSLRINSRKIQGFRLNNFRSQQTPQR